VPLSSSDKLCAFGRRSSRGGFRAAVAIQVMATALLPTLLFRLRSATVFTLDLRHPRVTPCTSALAEKQGFEGGDGVTP
jgi:hypothetical protein